MSQDKLLPLIDPFLDESWGKLEALILIYNAAEEGWKELDLSNKGLTEIPIEEIRQLSRLTSLDLSNNKIMQIPRTITQLSNLNSLYLNSNQITQIPEEIGQLSNLNSLYLNSNQIRQIPEEIGQLSNLNSLYLNSNQITQIPEEIGQLSNLNSLYLNSNQITQIPKGIGQLFNLNSLDLSSNQITQIPKEIGQLFNLTSLYISNNQIIQLPEEIGQLFDLTSLYISNNQITQIPIKIGHLFGLAELYLNSNQITNIPEEIGQLLSLTELSLKGNQITNIPEEIGQLSNLALLDLSSNLITNIPEEIGQLSNLALLDLSSNLITNIPEEVECLPKLKQLDLRENPLPISPEILGSRNKIGSAEGIFNYFRQLRSGEVRPLNEAKLILIGQGSVGKTSLIERLLHNCYNPNEPQTDGLNVKIWNIAVNSKDIRLNVWDFGGQEIYHATHQFFLTKRSLYLLVCNCRISEDENRIEYWLKLIESFGDQSPVIIVGNKKDEQPLDINRKALREKYPNIQAIIETSCPNNEGIEELRTAIFRQVADLKEVYDLLPLSWFKVKQQLEAMTEDFISLGLTQKEKVM